MTALPAVVATNAHRWMVEAVFEPSAIRITFANGDRFRFPLRRLGAARHLHVDRASIAPDGMSLEIPVAGREKRVELPWDLVRAECDPEFAAGVRASEEATAGSIGRKIGRLRRAAGLSQDALARRARIARATVNRIERGRLLPELSTLRRIARALGLPLPHLVSAGPTVDRAIRRRSRQNFPPSRRRQGADPSARRRRHPPDGIADLIGSVRGLPRDLSARTTVHLRATGYGRKRAH